MLYLLTYSWHEDYCPTILEGPKRADWEGYCKLHLDNAVDWALQDAQENEIWCGWPDIVNGLKAQLFNDGYREVFPEEVVFWGSSIIDSDRDGCGMLTQEQLKRIIQHNNKLQDDMHKDEVTRD